MLAVLAYPGGYAVAGDVVQPECGGMRFVVAATGHQHAGNAVVRVVARAMEVPTYAKPDVVAAQEVGGFVPVVHVLVI